MPSALNNDNADLIPVTTGSRDRENLLAFDFSGLEVGVAEYAEGPTGCTVFRFPNGATGVADVRGGAPGTVLSHREGWVDAICLAGGSVYGLEAVAGVSAELLAGKKYDTAWNNIAIVSGAVLYDFNEHRRNRAIYPDKNLGRAALRAAQSGSFPLGARGAGVCATVGKSLRSPYTSERAGQGGAVQAEGDVKIAVFTVVNAVGAIVDRTGKVVRGHFDPKKDVRHRIAEAVALSSGDDTLDPPPGNTTLSVVAINQPMGLRELRQLARQVHSSMARAVDPFHTINDGDVLYAVTTNELDSAPLDYSRVSYIASELAWDAVLCSF